MRQALAQRDVVTGGLTETKAFTIAATGKAFQVLIDKLYSDKPRAIVRELWSNAWDSHISAGKADVPFECQLPTPFTPLFRCRDFGTSLSHDDVMNLYTTVFQSTRDDSNDHNGAFGLGSKSPFAYTDTFTVTTWLNGEKRIYSCFIDNKYVPQIAHMLTEASDEPQGLEVAFPVKNDDMDDFVTAAKRTGLGFKVKPTIVEHTMRFTELETFLVDPNGKWELADSHSYEFNSRTAYAKQGCVVYPIDVDAMGDDLTHEQRAVLGAPFFMEFNLGELSITPSREALSYDSMTRDNILRVVDDVVVRVRELYSEKMKGHATYFEACVAYTQLGNDDNIPNALREMLTRGLKWRGRNLVKSISLSPVLNKEGIAITAMKWSQYNSHRRRNSRSRALKFEASRHLTFEFPDVIYFEDTHKVSPMSGGKIRYAFDKANESLPYGTARKTSFLWVRGNPNSIAWKRLLVQMGRPSNIIDVATLPKPPKDSNYVKKPVQLKRLDRGGYNSSLESTTVDANDDIIYVDLDRRDIIDGTGGTGTSTSTLKSVLTRLEKLGIVDAGTELIGVPRSCVKMRDANPHWRNLWTIVKEAVEANFDPLQAAKSAACKELLGQEELAVVRKLDKEGFMPADRKGVAAAILRTYARVKEEAGKIEAQQDWQWLAYQVGKGDLPEYKMSWQPMANRFKRVYPMTQHVYCNSVDVVESVKDYVNLVDKSKHRAQSAVAAVPLP